MAAQVLGGSRNYFPFCDMGILGESTQTSSQFCMLWRDFRESVLVVLQDVVEL